MLYHQLVIKSRKKAYECDITYGTNNEFGFDYLRENMRWSDEGRVQKNHNFCIIDEIDSILIDEARTPLIISGQAEDNTRKFSDVNRLVSKLKESTRDPETGDYPENADGDLRTKVMMDIINYSDYYFMKNVSGETQIIYGMDGEEDDASFALEDGEVATFSYGTFIRKHEVETKINHLYIGKRSGDDNGFVKLTIPNSQMKDGVIYTHAFISKKDAEKFYGEGNYEKVDFVN